MAEAEHWLEFHQEGNGTFTIRPPNEHSFYIVKGIWVHRTSGANSIDIVLSDGTNPMTLFTGSGLRFEGEVILSRDWYMTIDSDQGVNVSVTCQVVGAA